MKLLWVVAGLAAGAAVGGAVMLLLAPRSGEQTRNQIKEKVDQIKAEGQHAAETKRLELRAQFEELKQPAAPA